MTDYDKQFLCDAGEALHVPIKHVVETLAGSDDEIERRIAERLTALGIYE